jgi:hypothetical protein
MPLGKWPAAQNVSSLTDSRAIQEAATFPEYTGTDFTSSWASAASFNSNATSYAPIAGER